MTIKMYLCLDRSSGAKWRLIVPKGSVGAKPIRSTIKWRHAMKIEPQLETVLRQSRLVTTGGLRGEALEGK